MTGLRRRAACTLGVACLVLAGLSTGGAAAAVTLSRHATWTAPERASIADHIAEAARRFALPEHWIRAVMRAESAFNPRATSHAGAIGLMQVMPATYAELRARHGLGPDPYAPRDNVLAGAAYLRELHDAFGPSGFLAAYNAGPGRYRDHLATGRPLPLETRLYVAKIAQDLGGEIAAAPSLRAGTTGAAGSVIDPLAAPLFVGLGDRPAAGVSTDPASASSLFPRPAGSGS